MGEIILSHDLTQQFAEVVQKAVPPVDVPPVV